MGKTAENHTDNAQDVAELLANSERSTLLRFSTAGSVDDGKSTLIGRLLHDSKNIYEDTLQSLEQADAGDMTLALLTDGLRAEREQGITIDVAYRYFSTPKRHFILADTPGHEQYTRNMATGSSTAHLTIILVDAKNGVITQTKRHAFIASLLGIPRFLVAVNKMDLVDWSQDRFEEIRREFLEFARKLSVKELRFVPISALQGDNVVEPSSNMPWYHGETVMEYLENVYVGSDTNLVDFRFPVQYVLRPDQNYRGYAGQIASGVIRAGEEVMVLPSLRKTRIKSIDVFSPDPDKTTEDEAFAPMSVALSLEDEIDIARGDMLVRSNNAPRIRNHFEAMLVWMNEEVMQNGRPYILLQAAREVRAFVDDIKYRVDVNTLNRIESAPLALNEIGRVAITTAKPLFLDSYEHNRSTGCFVLVDSESLLTVAAGMVIDRLPEEYQREEVKESGKHFSKNIHREEGFIPKVEREKRWGHAAVTLWFTGLSGSGKSSIAKALESELFDEGRLVYRLDGDNLRFGLNRDLGFAPEDRAENIRRAAEVARLFNQAGVTVICSFISPFQKDRAQAREIIGPENFLEVFISTPIEECEKRDPRGLYSKARSGEIREFTGVSSPYEAPSDPDVVVDTVGLSVEESVEGLLSYLKTR